MRLGPLSKERVNWPVLAAYTPHPNLVNLDRAEITTLYEDLVKIYRNLTQHIMRTLKVNSAWMAQAAQPQLAATGISPQTLNAIMGKVHTSQEQIPFWIAQKTSQLEVFCPHTGPQDKHRILTICLSMRMAPSGEDCATSLQSIPELMVPLQ